MAHLNSIWEKTDSSYFEATKRGGRATSRELDLETASVSSSTAEDFAAIPREFRPSGGGRDLLEVSTSPMKGCLQGAEEPLSRERSSNVSQRIRDARNSTSSTLRNEAKDKNEFFTTERLQRDAEEPLSNERLPNVSQRIKGAWNSTSVTVQNEAEDKKEFFTTERFQRDAEEPLSNERSPNVSQRIRGARNSTSSMVQNEAKDKTKFLTKERFQRDIDRSSDEASKQNKSSDVFFYSHSSQTASTPKATNECKKSGSARENGRGSSEKSKPINIQDENPYGRFYVPDSNQSKATKEFEMHISTGQFREDILLRKDTYFNKNLAPDRKANNQNTDKDGTNIHYFNKKLPPKFQNKSRKYPNRTSFTDKGAQNFKREVIVENSIKWRNDLCEFKKPENKPKYFYEYTKTTKESVGYVPLNSKDADAEVKEKPYHNLKREQEFFSNSPRKDFGHNKHRHENQKEKEFYSHYKPQRNEAMHFSQVIPEKSANKFEEHNCFQGVQSNNPIIVKHEIKVIHVNQQGRNNRIFHNSPQRFRPLKKDRNCKLTDSDIRVRPDEKKNNDQRGSSSKITNNDPKGDGEIVSGDTREHCSTKTEENVEDTLRKTRDKMVRISLKLKGSSSEPEYSNASRACDGEKAAELIKYGREISDLIAGSYVAISTFLSNYEQWKDFRRVTMLLFEEVEKNLSQSCHKNKKIIEVAELVGSGCKMVQYVPHLGVSVAAKVIAVLSDVVARMFSSSKSAKSIGIDDFQLRLCLQRDMDATDDIYSYGIQCDFQFQETCQIIEEFHGAIQARRFKEFEETFETGFLKEISLLNPKHPPVFYKKLGRLYKVLDDRQESEEAKAFCRAFDDWPEALSTVSRLHRRFKTENWDSSSVMKAWEEVFYLLQNKQSAVEDVVKKIQDCICVLMREQTVMERYALDLQRQC